MEEDKALDDLLARYSSGDLPRKKLEEMTGLWFGEILSQMRKRKLPLPVFDYENDYPDSQVELYKKVFGRMK